MAIQDPFNDEAKPSKPKPDLRSGDTLRFNPEDYADQIKSFDLDPVQAAEFLQTLWDILILCADVEMSIDPVSLICGQNTRTGEIRPLARFNMVKSDDQKTQTEEA